ncbi:ExbD/TolR family protein [Marinobacter caseinilyticus]|uniref:ExbD/TolR family protein n=1 Tax=Marinobacter caseinilyticus TaxID=2692195 RepID=UPI00140A742C|nr:biopolymer transporter ExbD [Marinobacter caseinilyticus]
MRRKHRRLHSEADLDITAFMNLMIVLVPVLLLNMVFAHTRVLELNFPNSDGSVAEQEESLQLQVMILDAELVVADNKGAVIKAIPKTDAGHDFGLLSDVMQSIKARLPEKDDITIMAKKDTTYQTLVSVMDTVRSFEAVVAGSVVDAELFPEISIADAPELAGASGQLIGQGSQ